MTEQLHAHLDLIGGLAGDMFVAAAIDAGVVEIADLERALRSVGLGPVEIVAESTVRGAIAGTHIAFRGWHEEAESSHRHLSTIRKMLADSELEDRVIRRATAMFERLGRAEAAVHGMELEDVHFHEVGAVDSILDFVAAAWIIETLRATWSFGTVPAGRGTIETAHGTIPVPAPATARLLQGFELNYRDVDAELVTPTGATILAMISELPGPRRGVLDRSGFGCGSRKLDKVSNVVRLSVLRRGGRRGEMETEAASGPTLEEVVQLVTDIDDESPEITAHVCELLMEQGALDVVCEPVQMKKGRLGCRLSVLCHLGDEEKLRRLLFVETSTFGIRRLPMERWVLDRTVQEVSTPFGTASVKIGRWGDEILKMSPEYESCAELAAKAGVPIEEVFHAVRRSARALTRPGISVSE